MDLPDNLESLGFSPEYDRHSVPDALLSRHALGERSWARLRVLSGSVTFVDLGDGSEVTIESGKSGVVPPALVHRVELEESARFQLEFFRETE
jgi:tellurite resistance-related uncharacterized protein